MKKKYVVWIYRLGVKVYLKDGIFTDCYVQDCDQADRLTENEANEWVKKSTTYCTYWIENI